MAKARVCIAEVHGVWGFPPSQSLHTFFYKKLRPVSNTIFPLKFRITTFRIQDYVSPLYIDIWKMLFHTIQFDF